MILDDEVLLSMLQVLQFILRVLRDQSQLLKCLVDLKVFLGHGVDQDPRRRGTLETDRGERAGRSELGRDDRTPQASGTTNTIEPNSKSGIRRKGNLSQKEGRLTEMGWSRERRKRNGWPDRLWHLHKA